MFVNFKTGMSPLNAKANFPAIALNASDPVKVMPSAENPPAASKCCNVSGPIPKVSKLPSAIKTPPPQG